MNATLLEPSLSRSNRERRQRRLDCFRLSTIAALLVCIERVISLASPATAISTAAQVSGQRLAPEPKIVQVHWSPALERFVLTNQAGELFSIRGVNYNTHYTRLPKEEHVSILRKDFQQMRDAGVNVITGYATFDETTLQVAKEHGLYVIMPYVLDLSGDYLDPSFRARAKQEFTAFIKRFENYGSLLMWNFDDEPLDNMIVRLRRPPEQVAAFSDFLLELAEHAYRTDRYHRPSWLKEPRDWYLDIFQASLKKARALSGALSTAGEERLDPSRYVVVARSAYGVPSDIQEWLPALNLRVEKEFDVPFVVGEYGVTGIDSRDRAAQLVQLWNVTQHIPSIGSAVYTYGPFQPDPNDPTDPSVADELKLVNKNGTPVDAAWGKLSVKWLAQAAEERNNTQRSSIPLAVPEFQEKFDQLGGYPSSGPIWDGAQVKQFFVEGKSGNNLIAYLLNLDLSSHQVEFSQVNSVIFNELGEYSLSGSLLKTYRENGGYKQFGASISNIFEIDRDQRRIAIQEFSNGRVLVDDGGRAETNP